jgi:hypothetical protein
MDEVAADQLAFDFGADERRPEDVKSDVSNGEARFGPVLAEARRLGALYWVLRPLSEHNGNLAKLDAALASCRAWAASHGDAAAEALEQAWREHKPEVV